MKIVVVVQSYTMGGTARHVLILLDALRRRGHTVHYAGPRDGWLGARVRELGIDGLDLPMHGMYDVLSALRLARYIGRIGADIVHGHSMRGTRYASWAGRYTGTPVVGTAHSTSPGRWLRGTLCLIPVSAAVGESLRAQGYGEVVCAPVYHGVEDHAPLGVQEREAQRTALGLAPDEHGLVMLGRLVADKGHDVVIEAMHRLRDLRLKLYLYGDNDGPWAEQLAAQIARHGLQSRVHFLGRQDQASHTLSAFDFFLHPSRREALSLSLLEASAQALPIIATRVGGIPEVVLDENTGLLVPVDDPTRLAAALRGLVMDPERARCLGTAARARFLGHFTISSMVTRVEAIYERLAHVREAVALAAPVQGAPSRSR